MLPLSLVATIFTKLWSLDHHKFSTLFLIWTSTETEENINIVLKELPVVDIQIERGWNRELESFSQRLTLLGIEFNVHGLLFYPPCVSIFRNESVSENLEILNTLSQEYPLARLAKNMFKIFYKTLDIEKAVEDLIKMTMTSYISVEIESMVKTLRRIQHCNRSWDEDCVFLYDRVSMLCDGLGDSKHFKQVSWWNPKMMNLKNIDCRRCKAVYVLFLFCHECYDDMLR